MIDITVCIPTIPQRRSQLRKAVTSVALQNYPASAISIAVDLKGEGSAVTRNRALRAVQTPWVAFLDDDDQLLAHHLEILANAAEKTGADVIYGLPRVIGPTGQPKSRHWTWGGPATFDPDLLRKQSYITVSSLVRTDLAKIAGFSFKDGGNGESYDDHGFYLNLLDAGAEFHHIHQETFIWNHTGNNTSGKPDKGDAARKV
jgi:glycosyltransferase involved in cell wall biosynthesis